jgi:hypothetical protein
MKRLNITALILCLMMLMSIGATAAYIPPDSPDASAYIANYSAKVINGGNGVLKVSFDVTGTTTMSSIGASTITIYKSNGTYVTTLAWFDSGRGGMMASNTFYNGDTESVYVGAGSYYAVVCFYAQKPSGGIGTKTVQTGTKTIT